MYNAQEVKQAAEGRWIEVFQDLAGVDRQLLDRNHHGCPKCGGDDRFRLTRSGDKMTGTFQVHPTCAPWPVEMVLVPSAPGAPRDPLQPSAAPPIEQPPLTGEQQL